MTGNNDKQYPINKKLAKRIKNLTIENENIVPFNKSKKFKDYYYNSNNKNKIPTLGEVKGKIVILSRENYLTNYAIQVEIPEMKKCTEYNRGSKNIKKYCYPVIMNYNHRIQDNYNLEQNDKWDIVYDILMNRIPSRTDCKKKGEFLEYEMSNIVDTCECGKDNKETKYFNVYNNAVNNRFYQDGNNKDTLNIDFMNMARADSFSNIGDWFDSIKDMANEVNKDLTNFNEKPFYHHWFILDFPSPDVIRKIYLSNNFEIPKSVYSKRYINSVDNSNDDSNNEKDVSNNALIISEYYKDLNIYLDNSYYLYNVTFSSQNGKSIKTKKCIQLKLNKQNENKQYVVKSNFKCVDNSRNQWHFKLNGDYLNIISAFDSRCLSYKNNKLTIEDCNEKNIYKEFIVKNKKLCSRIDKNTCLDDYEILPVPLESEQQRNLECPSIFFKFGYPCCSDSIEIDHTDEIGAWGYESGELCGIPFDTLDLQNDIN